MPDPDWHISYSRVWNHSPLWPWTTSPQWQKLVPPLASCKRCSPVWSHHPALLLYPSRPPHTPHGKAKLQEDQKHIRKTETHICFLSLTMLYKIIDAHFFFGVWTDRHYYSMSITRNMKVSFLKIYFLRAFPLFKILHAGFFLDQGRAISCKLYFHSWKLIMDYITPNELCI